AWESHGRGASEDTSVLGTLWVASESTGQPGARDNTGCRGGNPQRHSAWPQSPRLPRLPPSYVRAWLLCSHVQHVTVIRAPCNCASATTEVTGSPVSLIPMARQYTRLLMEGKEPTELARKNLASL